MAKKCAGCAKTLKEGEGWGTEIPKPDGTKVMIQLCASCKKTLGLK